MTVKVAWTLRNKCNAVCRGRILSPSKFYDHIMMLSGWCSIGSEDIPKDANKAIYWRKIGESTTETIIHSN